MVYFLEPVLKGCPGIVDGEAENVRYRIRGHDAFRRYPAQEQAERRLGAPVILLNQPTELLPCFGGKAQLFVLQPFQSLVPEHAEGLFRLRQRHGDARRDNPVSSGMITSTKTELQILQ